MTGVTVKFHGAAGTVTGSCFEVTGAGQTILVDCGLFQGTRSLEALNHEPLPFDPKKIDAVLLTHAHLDHSGRLPYLYAHGCKARTYCTAPSADIIKPLLQDAAKLQAADVERRNRRADRAGLPPFTPLYDSKDIAKLHKNVRAVSYCEENHLSNDVVVKAPVTTLDGYSNHADRRGLVEWIRDRTPIRGSLFLAHGEQRALSGLAETLAVVPDLPAAIIPALGETWSLSPGQRATRLTAGRPDASDLTASRDWISKLATLRQEVEEKLSEQRTNQDREKMLAALKRAVESA